MPKKKKQGHYCRICGAYKANESFSGKGYAQHICKECESLPQEKKNELQHINRIGQIAEKYSRSRQDWELLEKYARSTKYAEAAEFAQMILAMSGRTLLKNKNKNEERYTETVSYTELDSDFKEEADNYLFEVLFNYLLKADYIPQEKHKQKILDQFCNEISREYGSRILIDESLNKRFNEVLISVVADFSGDGINFISYEDSLTITQTQRLVIRKFTKDDLSALHTIMEKPEVMYAWEHGFTRNDTRKWLNHQLIRYRKDGYGYFAVVLKETGRLIGQVGLLKSKIQDSEVTELGYIFDNLDWKQGYCMEAAKACVQVAFSDPGIQKLYCSIRPENTSSIRICEKLGMEKRGEHTVLYREKEMPHTIYVLNNSIPACQSD